MTIKGRSSQRISNQKVYNNNTVEREDKKTLSLICKNMKSGTGFTEDVNEETIDKIKRGLSTYTYKRRPNRRSGN